MCRFSVHRVGLMSRDFPPQTEPFGTYGEDIIIERECLRYGIQNLERYIPYTKNGIEIFRGKMGEQNVFIKVNFFKSMSHKQRFNHCLEVHRQINRHPHMHIISAIHTWTYDRQDMGFIVLPFIEGTDYYHIVTSEEKVNVRQRLLDFRTIVKSIQHLHQVLKIAHLDIKLCNVMVSAEGNIVKLIDFDLAAPLGSTIYNPRGTAPYISPELYNLRHRYDGLDLEKCDIFSLGILLYSMLLRHEPFQNVRTENYRYLQRNGLAMMLRMFKSSYQTSGDLEQVQIVEQVQRIPEMVLLMESLMQKKSADRPTIETIIHRIDAIILLLL